MIKGCKRIAVVLGGATLALALMLFPALSGGDGALAQQVEGRAVEQPSPQAGNVPGGHLGTTSDTEIWRAVRKGVSGTVSIPDKQAGQLIQSEGDNWRAWRNGPITVGGVWGVFGMIGFLALFFVVRGRVRIDSGFSGKYIERFNGIERFTHWMTATSFIAMAITGLNMLYGRYVLLPVLGPEAFAVLLQYGKYVHNYMSFAFVAGLLIMIVMWLRHNLPTMNDLIWLSKFGGLLTTNVHPPSEKFNAGQKIMFWMVIVLGGSLVASGLSLMFPYQLPMFAWTFEVINVLGFNLPTELTPVQEMQWSQWWHAIVGLVMIVGILGHIYIGSAGMEGAFAAMGTGQVDENWAREHHNLWVARVKGEPMPGSGGGAQPAE